MDDIGLMAVVDTGENLLHEDSTVTLCEFAALKNFVEKLTSLADSKINLIRSYEYELFSK